MCISGGGGGEGGENGEKVSCGEDPSQKIIRLEKLFSRFSSKIMISLNDPTFDKKIQLFSITSNGSTS